jgi:hypothetical protein
MYDGTQFLLMNDPAGGTGGDVVGPASATDNAIVRFDGGTGKLVQNSVVTIADSTGDISGVGQLNATTVDATNVEVTNIKAKDGTAAATIADSTGVITVSTQLNVDNLNFSVNTISSTDTNGNIVLAPNGTGDVQVDADTLRVGDSNANATITTNGTGDLILNTNSGTNSGSITIADGAGGDITATPNGNGSVVITNSGTSNALRITQTGSGNALLVEDSSNPDSGPFVVNAEGQVCVGTLAPIRGIKFTVAGTASTNDSGGINIRRHTDSSSAPNIIFDKSRGTITSPTIVANGDNLCVIRADGFDGTGYTTAAQILIHVDGTPSTNDMPGRLSFATTADGASSPTERVRINSAGLTTVGYSAATGAALSTTVAAKLLSANTTYTDSATAASGTVTHGTINSFDNPAIAASNASVTYTNASTVYINGAPTAGSNVTITNPYALYVAAGATYLGGNLTLSGGTANGVLYLDGSKVATSGSALTFDGSAFWVAASSVSSDSLNVNGFRFGSGTFKQQYSGGFDFQQYYTAAGQASPQASIFVDTAAWGVKITGSEQMRLTSTGLGIGTSSPVAKFQVVGASGAGIRVDQGNYNYYGAYTHQWLNSGFSSTFMTLDSSGNLGLGGSAARATTVGTAVLNIFNGTAPVGTLTNGISLYSSSGEAYVMDAAGNATLFSPHDAKTNEWVFKSKHTPTGKVLKIDVEKLLRFVNDHFGLDAVHEFIES